MVFNYFNVKFVEKDKKKKKRKKDNFTIGQLFSLYGSLHEFNSLGKSIFFFVAQHSMFLHQKYFVLKTVFVRHLKRTV